MLNGPIVATVSPIGSRIETIALVSWSATIAVPAITAARSIGRARRRVALRARDRLQGVRRRADADIDPPRRLSAGGLGHPCSCAACRRGRGLRTGWRRAAPPGSQRRTRRRSVGSVVDARERVVDLGDHVVGILAERLVDLAVDEVGRVVGEVLIAGGGVDLATPSSSADEVGGGAEDAFPKRSSSARRRRGRWSCVLPEQR